MLTTFTFCIGLPLISSSGAKTTTTVFHQALMVLFSIQETLLCCRSFTFILTFQLTSANENFFTSMSKSSLSCIYKIHVMEIGCVSIAPIRRRYSSFDLRLKRINLLKRSEDAVDIF